MGQDAKYGKVTTEHGDIPDDEPVFVLRAQDKIAIGLLSDYEQRARAAECSDEHIDRVMQNLSAFEQFSINHADRMKLPD